MRSFLTGRWGAGVAAAGLLGLGLGVGLGFGGTAASAASDRTASAAATPADHTFLGDHPRLAEARLRSHDGLRPHGGIWAGGGVHGEATVKTGKGFQVVAGQRGKVTAVSPTSLTVTSEDGYVGTYVINADTRLRIDGDAAKVSDLHPGATVRVGATVKDGTRTAVVVAQPQD
ncbi:hypothetical protein CcI156_15720 [Frankia sp. CcI156]|uniref:DUF5666 domain-containing protein n=1 Tax=Frankia casuarinae (strain DSM 45818 / CECT 9043 / HFP020203 / CcI3) TaxID=106370 RepID=Q2JED4_FRACC|nr:MULTISPECIES: DUF5666 domain-containing protein [Frankia]ABD10358.1 hypothetical protein Francci3_0974 [Frankia casuarinae]ETA01427.1 hypothetical protein CcI6DRAFT_03169 [Frankia sp. CcI6]EYT91678.1 hypothetical protein ThrDRAFT_02683 [Frankia casuarinae]KDA41987.1 hypothetical protein BMG523Draft_03194 [Frankia sp. BMG5.23]OFB39905.1 hypothetical protein Manayef4_19895 [Frankia sp. CgIM4]